MSASPINPNAGSVPTTPDMETKKTCCFNSEKVKSVALSALKIFSVALEVAAFATMISFLSFSAVGLAAGLSVIPAALLNGALGEVAAFASLYVVKSAVIGLAALAVGAGLHYANKPTVDGTRQPAPQPTQAAQPESSEDETLKA